MFAEVTEAVEEMVIPIDGTAVLDALRTADRLDAKIVDALADFDEADEWDRQDGATSTIAWLAHHGHMTRRRARRLMRIARRLRRLPTLRRAWLDGTVTGGLVDVIVDRLSDRTTPLFANHEDDLIPTWAHLDITDAQIVMDHWVTRARAELDRDPTPDPDPDTDGGDGEDGDGGDHDDRAGDTGGNTGPDPDGTAHLSDAYDGRGRLDANLTPEAHAIARAALRLALGTTDPDDHDDHRSPAQHRHDALTTIFQFFCDNQQTQLGGRHRPHINIVIPLAWLLTRQGQATLLGGTGDTNTTITSEDARRIACDANIHRVITKGPSTILDYGRATKTIAAALFTVLCLRDHHCRFPGCDRPATWTDAHHIHHWIDGGPTRPDNLVLLCRRHHQVIHRKGWTIHLDPHDATVTVTDPNGRERTSRPPPHTALAA